MEKSRTRVDIRLVTNAKYYQNVLSKSIYVFRKTLVAVTKLKESNS